MNDNSFTARDYILILAVIVAFFTPLYIRQSEKNQDTKKQEEYNSTLLITLQRELSVINEDARNTIKFLNSRMPSTSSDDDKNSTSDAACIQLAFQRVGKDRRSFAFNLTLQKPMVISKFSNWAGRLGEAIDFELATLNTNIGAWNSAITALIDISTQDVASGLSPREASKLYLTLQSIISLSSAAYGKCREMRGRRKSIFDIL